MCPINFMKCNIKVAINTPPPFSQCTQQTIETINKIIYSILFLYYLNITGVFYSISPEPNVFLHFLYYFLNMCKSFK